MNSIRKAVSLMLALALILGCGCVFAEAGEWVCPACGAANTTNFCTKCGTQRPEDIACPNCGTTYPADSGTVFCGNCGTKLQGSAAVRYEGNGFDSPEEALICYMEGLKNLDFEQMLSAFAWETQMEHYSLQAYFERLRVYQTNMRPRMPSVNNLMFSANVNILRFNQVDVIYRSLEHYILGEDYPETGFVQLQNGPDEVAAFLQQFDNGRIEKLAQMTNIRILSPDEVTEDRFSMERNQENFIRQTACYGADEAVNLVGAGDVGGETLYCFPTICRYGDRWYLVSVSSMTSMILGVPVDLQGFICGEGSPIDILY